MNEATKSSYRKLAENFYRTRLGGEQPTPKRIADALKACACDYRPAYWRRLRNALAFDQRERGFEDAAQRLDATKNPVTKDGSVEGVKPKQPRAKRVAKADEARLFQYFKDRDDAGVTAALYVAKMTGARPAEMKGICIVDGKVFIPGAKKSHGGSRGADRLIELPPQTVYAIGKAVRHLQSDMGPIQDRIRAAGKKLWPQRKAVPSLYSWRHQLGSELKASGIDRAQVAYVMGHQSTESVDRYGNAKTARGGRVLPKPEAGADLSRIRVDHSEPPARPAPVKEAITTHSSAALVEKLNTNEQASLPVNHDAIRRLSIAKVGKRQEVSPEPGLKR